MISYGSSFKRLAWALILFFAAGRAWSATGSYALKSSVTLNGPWVTVGDLLDPAPDTAVAQIKLKRLALPGKDLEVSRDLLLLKVREARLGVAMDVTGLASVVHASAKIVPASQVSDFAQNYIRERLVSLSGVADVSIKPLSQIQDLTVPDRPVKFQITPRAGQNWRGNLVLTVNLIETAEDATELGVGQAMLPFLVKVKQNLLVASRLVRRGELISQDNTAVAAADASYLSGDGYASLDGAMGLKAKSPIGEGKPIESSMLERPPVIVRGDIVKLMVRSGLVVVSVSAKALRDAAVGDSIPVEIQDSKKELQGVVQDAHTVVSDTR